MDGIQKSNREKLTLFILNFNGERHLRNGLNSVFKQKSVFDEVLLVDNASEDHSLDIVRRSFPTVKIIQLKINVGIGEGKRIGYKAASFDRILYMDNDIVLDPNCADLLMEALTSNTRAAIAMPRVLYSQNRSVIQYDGADIHYLGMMMLQNANRLADNLNRETRKIGCAVGCCFLIDRRRLGSLNPFDESFFYCFDDLDFSMKIRLLGHDIISVPSAFCYHGGGTKGVSLRDSRTYSALRIYNTIRNRWLVLLSNYELRTLIIFSPVFLIYEAFQFIGIIKKGWFKHWLKSLLWISRNLGLIRKKRKAYLSCRIMADRDILRNGSIPFSEALLANPFERSAVSFLNRVAKGYWKLGSKYL